VTLVFFLLLGSRYSLGQAITTITRSCRDIHSSSALASRQAAYIINSYKAEWRIRCWRSVISIRATSEQGLR
jgi:hypothetical protein